MDFKIAIKELKKSANLLEAPRFNICYSPGMNCCQPHRSYQIISALKNGNNMVLEINSSLLNVNSNQRNQPALDFLETIRNQGWNFRYRKIAAASSSMNSLEMLFSFVKKPDNTAHQIFAEIPPEIWQDETRVVPLLPVHGVRYYIGPQSSAEMLESLFNGQNADEQLIELFKMICYDCSSFGQMGVYSRDLTLAELQQLLGQ